MKLKPCPFCGKNEVYIDHDSSSLWTIGCPYCGFHGHAFSTKKAAIKAWNMRDK